MKNGTTLGIITAVLFIAGCGGNNKKMDTDSSPAIEVKVNTVKEDGANPFLAVSGKIEAVNSSNLSTRMMGYVDKIHVQVGEKVHEGELLLRINNADITAKLAQVNAGITEASAAFSNAEKDFVRYSNLFKESSASQKELDDVTANYNMAKARLEAAKQLKNEVTAQLAYTNIRAPFSGIVANRFIKEGDLANPGMPLLEIEAPGNFQVVAMVPESEILRIKNDTEVTVILKSIDKMVKGKVTEVSSSSKNTGGQYVVKVLLNKDDGEILSGMFATVQFPVEKSASSGTVFIPRESLVTKGQLSGVYTVSQSNTAILRWLRLGRINGDSVEVLSGLAPNEQYIINAERKLYNGAKISIQ